MHKHVGINMKKRFLTLLTLLISAITYACSCGIPKPILEFKSADYVFKGKVISKVYASDSLNYTVTFEVFKHYKNGEKPKKMEFTFTSEGEYTGEWTSCDWNVNKDENWLVYAYYLNDKLTFGYYCSNSKPIENWAISKSEQQILDNGNSFKIDNYIYQFENEFNITKPISNIDSIFKTGKIKNYENPYTWLELFIDKKGNLNSVTTSFNYQLETDSIYNLPTEFKIKLNKPITDFEQDAIELINKIPKWEIKRHKKTNIPVSYIRHIVIRFDKEKNEWIYEL